MNLSHQKDNFKKINKSLNESFSQAIKEHDPKGKISKMVHKFCLEHNVNLMSSRHDCSCGSFRNEGGEE